MNTESEKWQKNANGERTEGNRERGRGFNREGGYNRSSFSRDGGARSSRPRYNNGNEESGERRSYGDRPQRSFNRRDNNGERGFRPQRSFVRDGEERSFRPRYNNNNEGGERRRTYGDRPQRSFNRENNGDRPFRPRYNSNNEGGERRSYGDRPQRSFNRENNGERSFRPRYNDNNGFRSQGGFNRQNRSDDYDPNAKYSKKKQIEYKEAFVDPDAPIRLNKYLANAGVCSRREADEFIAAGVVSVNGEIVTELGTKIKRSDVVKFHDEPISIERKVYVLLNKPKDCVTTSDDPQARKTVMDLVKDACDERIYPVGRLDRNTTGVLLLTNDGELASKLTHPKYLKKKIYQVQTDKNVTKADMEQIAAGIELEDGEIAADEISYVDDTKRDVVGIEIHSGKNRIVRRIFESLGYKVVKLDRVYFAGLTKKGLRRGDWRYLTENEVNFLRMGSFE